MIDPTCRLKNKHYRITKKKKAQNTLSTLSNIMSTLTKEQIEIIRNNLKEQPTSRSFLFNEYVDHISCDIESLMDKGISFEQALKQVTGSSPDQEIAAAHKETSQLINAKFILIKKILYLAAILFVISWIVNLPVITSWTSLGSFLILGLLYFRVGIDFAREVRSAPANLYLSILAFLSFLGNTSGIILIFLSRNYGINTSGHGPDAMVFGWFFFSVLCLIYFIREYKTSVESPSRRRNNIFIWLSGFNLLLALLSVASFPLYSTVSNYLFYFILLILAFNLVIIIWLAIKKYFKYTLIAALFTGSFMLVFIHSNIRHKLPGGQPTMHTISVNVKPAETVNQQTIYLYFYYDQYPDHKFTIPMRLSPEGYYTNAWPSYPYKGYLVYKTGNDSIDAGRAFSLLPAPVDSLYLNIPKIKEYNIE